MPTRAIVGAILFTVFALVVPGEPEPMDKHGTIDWFGAYLGVAGLILFNFVWKYVFFTSYSHICTCFRSLMFW